MGFRPTSRDVEIRPILCHCSQPARPVGDLSLSQHTHLGRDHRVSGAESRGTRGAWGAWASLAEARRARRAAELVAAVLDVGLGAADVLARVEVGQEGVEVERRQREVHRAVVQLLLVRDVLHGRAARCQ